MPSGAHIGIAVGVAALGIGVAVQQKTTAFRSPRQTAALAQGHFPYEGNSIQIRDFPPPPLPGSVAMQRDEEARTAALHFRGTPRYALAALDSVRTHPETVNAFSCALGTNIDEKDTPHLYRLMTGVRLAARSSAYLLKSRYKRARPFVAFHEKSCSAADSELQGSGSYPSAGSAVGWAYALVLADINLARREPIMKRGFEYGQSRIICDAEWQSDVDAGRAVADEIIDRMRGKEQFQSDMDAARGEVGNAIRSNRAPSRNCASESKVLATN